MNITKELLNKKANSTEKHVSTPAKATVWYIVCNFLQKGVSVITVPIFTRLMTTDQYGSYSVYLAWFSILIIFTSLNLYYGVFNNAMLKFKEDRERFVSSMQGLSVTVTLIVFVIYLLNISLWNKLLGLPSILVILMFVELLFTPQFLLWSALQRFEYKYKLLVAITILKSVLNPVLGIIAVYSYVEKDIARVVSIVVVEVLFCGFIMVYQFVKGRAFYVKEYWKYALGFNLPLIPHYLSGSLLNQADRVMIQNIIGTAAVGIYSVAYNIGMLLQLVVNALNSSYTPWMYQCISEKKYKEVKRTTNFLLLSTGILVYYLVLLSPELMKFFASEEYYSAVNIIPPVAVSGYFMFVYLIFANIEFFFEANKFIMVASVGAAIINITLNLLLIPRFGYYAAGFTTLVSYIIYSIAHLIFAEKIMKNKMNNTSMIDIKFLAIWSLVITVFSLLSGLLYEQFITRYIMVFIITFVVFLFRKKIFTQLKSFS